MAIVISYATYYVYINVCLLLGVLDLQWMEHFLKLPCNQRYTSKNRCQSIWMGISYSVCTVSHSYTLQSIYCSLCFPNFPVTTACVLAEARSLGPDLLGAVLVLKRFQQRHCSHGQSPVLAADCIKSLVG